MRKWVRRIGKKRVGHKLYIGERVDKREDGIFRARDRIESHSIEKGREEEERRRREKKGG